MAMIHACIFDLDGVIVDTANYHYKAWKRLCNELGFDLTLEENEELKGISRDESLEILLRKADMTLSEADKEKYKALKNDWYLEFIEDMGAKEILPGVIPFLYEIKEMGQKLVLGSASKNASTILRKTGLYDLFDEIIDGRHITKGKPHPETFLLGAEAVRIDPSECVVFEDSVAGIEAALAAKMYAVGVGNAMILEKAHYVIPGFENVTASFLKDL